MSFENKRKTKRKRLTYRAFILSGDGPKPCIVEEVSAGGARIVSTHSVEVPADFMLTFSERGAPCHKCHVVWRTNLRVGISWSGPDPIAACNPEICLPGCQRLKASGRPSPATDYPAKKTSAGD
jgi:hypothetical protein